MFRCTNRNDKTPLCTCISHDNILGVDYLNLYILPFTPPHFFCSTQRLVGSCRTPQPLRDLFSPPFHQVNMSQRSPHKRNYVHTTYIHAYAHTHTHTHTHTYTYLYRYNVSILACSGSEVLSLPY